MSNLKTTPDEALRERQIALELEAIEMGVKRYNDALDAGGHADSLPGRALTKKVIDPMVLVIESFIERAGAGKAGRKHVALQYVTKVEPEVAALLTARIAIDGAADTRAAQSVALSIASAIQDHLNITRLAKEKPGLFAKVTEQLKTSTSARHRSGVFDRVVAKYGTKEVSWDQREKLLLGMKLLELFIEATGVVRLVRVTTSGAHTPVEVHFGEEWAAELTRSHEQCALLSPVHLPMVHPPRDWVHPYAGGYLTEVLRPRLVRTRSREYLDELGSLDLSRVMAAINNIQSTPWQINRKVYDVMKTLFDANQRFGSMPAMENDELPLRPEGIPEDAKIADLSLDQQEAMKEWKREAAKVHEANAAAESGRVALGKKLYVAERFKDEGAIYFPHYLDFRGRVYPFASYLNPQGDDLAKGLLQFAEGKPLGATGGYWLAVHIANLFGVDKVPFDERVQWVMDNEEAILDSALDPLDGQRFWNTADDGNNAFGALAACFDWLGFKVNGEAHVSHLPIAMDGSCSGLQHFSALLRDEVGGAAVNLVPQERPADVYTAVSKRAQVLSDASGSEYATTWEGKFCRKVAKQPTMTLCYSATKRGMVRMIEKALGDLDGTGRYLNGDTENYHAANYAAGVIWDALGETVVKAREAMDWLQAVSKVLAKANLPIRWTTPMGLPVMQAYRKEKGEVVEAIVEGRVMKLTLSVDTQEICPRRNSAAIAPNYIHSMDGAHLMATAELSRLNGITSLAVIHDSFGTHACDTDVLHAVIREAFVRQYTPNQLQRFRDEIAEQLEAVNPELLAEIPELPTLGALDLDAVRDSDFLFA